MDPIKEAFSKIKEEMLLLKEEINQLRLQLSEIKTTQTHNSPQISQQTNIQTHNQTHSDYDCPVESLYPSNYTSSIGNEGVPTDRQTNTQTDQQFSKQPQNNNKSEFRQANDILESLDSIKKGIRLKFKLLTPQEMLVFSTIYGLEEQNHQEITYRTIASQIGLSESSIRDYINKLIKKGIPIDKMRQNNKTILLKISSDLKNIATLATIQNLREL
ncbi:MAG: helix-turn-helix domain-containing protein [Candidatus Peregrinibacteria bacterium]|nr:helix-turn-helix domain-containing protein [Candidatus Peregrinibacteria bacterium]